MTSSFAPLSLALALAALAALAAGCATDPSSSAAPAEPSTTREYRTGSNIPVREPKTSNEHDKTRAETPKGAEPAKTN